VTAAYTIGFFSDTHLGYAAKVRVHKASGINERVRDGMLALHETVTAMIEANVDLVIQGGDLFHWSHPQIAEITFARREFERLAAAGIPSIINTGNHDASAEAGKTAAIAVLHDPARKIECVLDRYRVLRPVDGLAIHAISHYGLSHADRIVPEPADGEVSVLTAHGTALIPGHEIFACAESAGEQPIGLDLLTDTRFVGKFLGHYHGMGALPGIPESSPAVYAGSALRRGFSDPEGGRGWILITIHTDGTLTWEPRYIKQRPQYDLPVVDATGLTGDEVHEAIRGNIAGIDPHDAIIRQVVTNVTAQHRAGIDLPGLAPLVADALQWMPRLERPKERIIMLDSGDPDDGTPVEMHTDSLTTAGSSDLPAAFSTWVTVYADAVNLPAPLRPVVAERGEEHLKAVSTVVDDGNADLAEAPAMSTPDHLDVDPFGEPAA
jgi:DNA repair exonuclease SbcCD nuclease subunit